MKQDQIDLDLINGINKLPDKGHFIKDRKLNFDTFLMLYKEIYTWVRAREVENFYKLLEKRKQYTEKDASVEIKKEYAEMVVNAMRADRALLPAAQKLTAEHLNTVQSDFSFKGSDLQTFLMKSFEKGDDSYKQFHDLVKMGIENSKPKTYEARAELTKT